MSYILTKILAFGGDPNRRTPGPAPTRAGPRCRLRRWPPPRRGGIPIVTHSEEVRLSHIVTIRTEVRDPAAIGAACRRLGLPEPVQGTAQLYSGAATGTLIKLP